MPQNKLVLVCHRHRWAQRAWFSRNLELLYLFWVAWIGWVTWVAPFVCLLNNQFLFHSANEILQSRIGFQNCCSCLWFLLVCEFTAPTSTSRAQNVFQLANISLHIICSAPVKDHLLKTLTIDAVCLAMQVTPNSFISKKSILWMFSKLRIENKEVGSKPWLLSLEHPDF